MTDKKTLSNTSIKLMWSKCDTDKDGYLDFEEFREMILRARARKELKTLEEEEELNRENMEILQLDKPVEVKTTFKAAETEESNDNSDEDIEEDIAAQDEDEQLEPPLEDDISEEIDFEEDQSLSAKVGYSTQRNNSSVLHYDISYFFDSGGF